MPVGITCVVPSSSATGDLPFSQRQLIVVVVVSVYALGVFPVPSAVASRRGRHTGTTVRRPRVTYIPWPIMTTPSWLACPTHRHCKLSRQTGEDQVSFGRGLPTIGHDTAVVKDKCHSGRLRSNRIVRRWQRDDESRRWKSDRGSTYRNGLVWHRRTDRIVLLLAPACWRHRGA
jgi:hypothetical protein